MYEYHYNAVSSMPVVIYGHVYTVAQPLVAQFLAYEQSARGTVVGAAAYREE